MKRAILLFGAIGGLGVPAVFTLLGWALSKLAPGSSDAFALLYDIQLPLWPMSKLFLAEGSGKHWLYLPLAAILSNALIYVAVGLLSAWGRTNRWAFIAAMGVAAGALFVAQRGFGTGAAGAAIATLFAFVGLAIHHRQPRSDDPD